MVREKFLDNLQHAMDLGREKGGSHWLTVLPLSERGFTLCKGAFRDAVSLRYGWNIPYLSTHCVCGKRFAIEHAFSCPTSGFPTLRHNLIRDITADLLIEVCHSVSKNPHCSHSQVSSYNIGLPAWKIKLMLKCISFIFILV